MTVTSARPRHPQCPWGPRSSQNVHSGETIDTCILGVSTKNDKVTSAHPWGPQCPRGPESAQIVKS